MGFFSNLFSFTQELAIDLGTANTVIIADGSIAVNEPSVVALDQHSEKMIAVGDRAKLMYEKTNNRIRVIRPLRDGVIADFSVCEKMLQYFINKVHENSFLQPSPRVLICVPCKSTQVERRAIRESALGAGAREVFLIEGHTDATGPDDENLSLSDRRAETVAVALSEQFQVPAENLTTQGYGEQYLKVATDGPERQNRRVTARRITPLLTGQGSTGQAN